MFLCMFVCYGHTADVPTMYRMFFLHIFHIFLTLCFHMQEPSQTPAKEKQEAEGEYTYVEAPWRVDV